MRWSSAAGASVCTVETFGGCDERIDAIRLAGLPPLYAFVPVSIS